MATTATISISSDIAPGFGGISESMTLTQAGSLVDIDSTTGFSIRKLWMEKLSKKSVKKTIEKMSIVLIINLICLLN